MDYYVTAVMHHPDTSNFPTVNQLEPVHSFNKNTLKGTKSYVVVCTQGEGDTETLEKAIALEQPYLAFVSSRRKASTIFSELLAKGIPQSSFKHIKTPAGLDIGAKLPEEVAISILAQIIQAFRLGDEVQKTSKVELQNDDYYMNPVCNLPIQKSSAKYVLEHNNQQVYFCCDNCKTLFEKEPELYLQATT